MNSQAPKTPEGLRKFGLVMAGAFAVFGAFFLWKGKGAASYFLILAGLFAAGGLLAPTLLAPIEKYWMLFAEKLSIVSTTIILILAYYLIITPFGLLIRLLGKDLLDMKGPSRDSYWHPIEPDGPASRPDKPF